MDIEKIWVEITEWLSESKTIGLPRGQDFNASFNSDLNAIEIIPSKTGIPRVVNRDEWIKFGEKYNSVVEAGYEPLRPGHYARVTYNSSYIVGIVRSYGYSE